MEDGVAAWLLGGDGGGGSDRPAQSASELFNGAWCHLLDSTWHAMCPATFNRRARVEEAVTDRWGRSQIISNRI
jgi:hypothetical protein